MTASEYEEIEMKLELSPAAADILDKTSLFSAEPVVICQHTVYFDTPDQRLAKSGLSLRIRRSGRKRVQTIKVEGPASAGLFIRREWERQVDDDQPVLDDSLPIPALLGDNVRAIAPLFIVEIERRVWSLDAIEVVLDRGRIVAGERVVPVCEIELEQKGGDFAALFGLARQIAAMVPVHLGVLSKAQRGYRLLGAPVTASKAGLITLTPSMTAASSFQMIARACITHFRLNEPLVLEYADPKALYQTRVALRRLRSAFAIYKAMLAGDRLSAFGDELRWLAGELGKARDLDVLIGRVGDGPLHKRLDQARSEAYANVAIVLQSDRARTLMTDLVEWIAIGEWCSRPEGADTRDLPAREFAVRSLERFRRKVEKGGRDLKDLNDEARHKVRKDAKKLRYAAEFFATLCEGKRERRRHKKFVATLKDLLEEFGALNDLATAPEVLARLGLSEDPQAKALLVAHDRAKLLKAAAQAYDALVDTKRFWR